MLIVAVPSADEVAQLLDDRLESVVGANEIRLQRQFGLESLVPSYIGAFPKIRNYPGRMHILYWICRYARVNREVVELARTALYDRSQIVRHHACGILAFAQHKEAVFDLRKLLNHKDPKSRADARAAIDAILEGNHHLWVDRKREGNVFWDPGEGR